MSWILGWKIVFIIGIGAFTYILGCVAIGGWKDLSDLRAHHRKKKT